MHWNKLKISETSVCLAYLCILTTVIFIITRRPFPFLSFFETVSSESPLRRFPLVLDLLYWRDRKKSAVVLVITLIALYVLATYPLILVFSYLGLAVLGGTFCFRVYRLVEARIKNKDAPNPFQ